MIEQNNYVGGGGCSVLTPTTKINWIQIILFYIYLYLIQVKYEVLFLKLTFSIISYYPLIV